MEVVVGVVIVLLGVGVWFKVEVVVGASICDEEVLASGLEPGGEILGLWEGLGLKADLGLKLELALRMGMGMRVGWNWGLRP